jgi:hypothetical protein
MDNRVNRYLPIINQEIIVNKYPFPAQLITALIWVESRGSIGAINKKSGASGLMQIMPIALKDYNLRSGNPSLTMVDMRSKNDEKAHDQIRVGMWLLGNFWKGASKYLHQRLGKVSISDLVRIADSFYAAGPYRMRQLLDRVKFPTFDNALEMYPNSNALGHASKVWAHAKKAGAIFERSRIDKWIQRPITSEEDITPIDIDVEPQTTPRPIDGAIFGLILIAIFWFSFFKKGASNESSTN